MNRRSRRERLLVPLGFVVLLIGLAAGCGGQDDESSDESGPITIGMTAEQTGPLSVLAPAVDGAQKAVKKVNADGGVDGRDIELVVRDNASDPAKAIQNVNEFNQMGAAGMIGPSFSQNCAAVTPELAKEDLPGICISPNDLPENDSHIFGIGVAISQQDAFTYEYFSQSTDNVGVLAASDESGAQAETNAQAAEDDLGIDIQVETANPADTTFRPQIQKMISNGAGALYMTSCGPISITASGEAVALGFDGQVALIDCFASLFAADAVKGFANGKVITFAPDFMIGTVPEDEEKQAAIQEYLDAGGTRDIVEAAGWDALMLLADALDEAGSTDPSEIISTLEDDFSYVGVWSTQTITADDHRGAEIEGAMIPTVYTRDGQLEPAEQ
jgi:branched-chain amino acid transport system substrate-binding protein